MRQSSSQDVGGVGAKRTSGAFAANAAQLLLNLAQCVCVCVGGIGEAVHCPVCFQWTTPVCTNSSLISITRVWEGGGDVN